MFLQEGSTVSAKNLARALVRVTTHEKRTVNIRYLIIMAHVLDIPKKEAFITLTI